MRTALAIAIVLLGGCKDSTDPVADTAVEPAADTTPPVDTPPAPLELRDITDRIDEGPLSAHGVSLVDYTGDGWPDVTIAAFSSLRLYRNLGDGTFEDDIARAGFYSLATFSGQAVTWVDVDDDGDLDLYLGRAEENDALFINNGEAVFTDETEARGLKRLTNSQGASFGDLDSDGDLDLYLAISKGTQKGQPAPHGQRGDTNLVFHNDGNGHFTEATTQANLAGLKGGETFGSVIFDADGDGDMDIFAVNDFERDNLFLQKEDGRFFESVDAWLHKFGSGLMGLDVADFDGDGDLDIFGTDWGSDQLINFQGMDVKPHFEDRMQLLLGDGLDPGALWTGWGCAFADLDNDGDPDILTTSAIADGVGYEVTPVFRMGRMTLYENMGLGIAEGGLVDASDQAGEVMWEDVNGFGLAVGDIDRDGDLDALVGIDREATNDVGSGRVDDFRKRFMLLENVSARTTTNASLVLRLSQAAPNTFAVGARVDVITATSRTARVILAGSSYLSQNSYALHFGLGTHNKADRVEITWPGGEKQVLEDVEAGYREIARP